MYIRPPFLVLGVFFLLHEYDVNINEYNCRTPVSKYLVGSGRVNIQLLSLYKAFLCGTPPLSMKALY